MSDLKCVGCEMVSRGRFPYFDPDCPVHGPAIRAKGSAGMSEPQTEAGKAMLPRIPEHGYGDTSWLDRILAIEEQAAAEARRELLAKVEGLHPDDYLRHAGIEYIAASAIMGIFEDYELRALLDPSR